MTLILPGWLCILTAVALVSVPLFLYLIWCDVQLARQALWRMTDAVIDEIAETAPKLPDGTTVIVRGSVASGQK
ncbi:MAG TPA: hypothetical protein VI756_09380 [Blastocatellia bacterium]